MSVLVALKTDTKEKKLLNKVAIFAFFAPKKVFSQLHKITVKLSQSILTMSLLISGPGNVSDALLSLGVWKLSDFIKNIVICVPKMNKGLMGLERHEGD